MSGLVPMRTEMSGNTDRIEDLRRRKAKARTGGGEARISAQHAKGKMTARENPAAARS